VTGYESFCSTPCEPKYTQFSSVGNSVRRECVHSTRTSSGLNAVGMISEILLGFRLQVDVALRLLEARRKRQTRRVRFALAHGQIGHPPSEPRWSASVPSTMRTFFFMHVAESVLMRTVFAMPDDLWTPELSHGQKRTAPMQARTREVAHHLELMVLNFDPRYGSVPRG
jgi:hypothetical protein